MAKTAVRSKRIKGQVTKLLLNDAIPIRKFYFQPLVGKGWLIEAHRIDITNNMVYFQVQTMSQTWSTVAFGNLAHGGIVYEKA